MIRIDVTDRAGTSYAVRWVVRVRRTLPSGRVQTIGLGCDHDLAAARVRAIGEARFRRRAMVEYRARLHAQYGGAL